ncbi:hypothetical protein SprV_0802547700 [Sparganum proliferum]
MVHDVQSSRVDSSSQLTPSLHGGFVVRSCEVAVKASSWRWIGGDLSSRQPPRSPSSPARSVGLVPRRQYSPPVASDTAEDISGVPSPAVGGVGQERTVFCADSQKEQATIAAAGESVWTQHSPPGPVIYLDTDTEVIRNNQIARLRYSCQEAVKALGEFVLRLAGAVHSGAGEGVDTDDGGEFGSPKRQT